MPDASSRAATSCAARRTAVGPASPSRTAPACALCTTPGATPFSATGPAELRRGLRGGGDGGDPALLDEADPVGGQQRLDLVRPQPPAAARERAGEDRGGRVGVDVVERRRLGRGRGAPARVRGGTAERPRGALGRAERGDLAAAAGDAAAARATASLARRPVAPRRSTTGRLPGVMNTASSGMSSVERGERLPRCRRRPSRCARRRSRSRRRRPGRRRPAPPPRAKHAGVSPATSWTGPLTTDAGGNRSRQCGLRLRRQRRDLQPGVHARVGADHQRPARVADDPDPAARAAAAARPAPRRRRAGRRARRSGSRPRDANSASTVESDAAISAPVCDEAARAPADVRPALTASTGLARATRRATRAELARVAERLQVQRDDLRRGVLLPVLQQVVGGQVRLVAQRDERATARSRAATRRRSPPRRTRPTATRSRSCPRGRRRARRSPSGTPRDPC